MYNTYIINLKIILNLIIGHKRPKSQKKQENLKNKHFILI